MSKAAIDNMIAMFDSKDVVAQWDRRDELMIRFNGLTKSTLATYQREMESIPEFRTGILKPTHSVTWIHIDTFLWFLRWKQANRYKAKPVKPSEVSHD